MADASWVEAGVQIDLRRHKTTPKADTYFIPNLAATELQPWLAHGADTEGPLFQGHTEGESLTGQALSPRDVGRFFKILAIPDGLTHADPLSGHSLRVGMTQDLVVADLDSAAVMQAGRWSSLTKVARYVAKSDARRGAVARHYRRLSGVVRLPGWPPVQPFKLSRLGRGKLQWRQATAGRFPAPSAHSRSPTVLASDAQANRAGA